MPHPSLLTQPLSSLHLSSSLMPSGPPKHRHSSPSGPWPFMDIDAEVDTGRLQDADNHYEEVTRECGHDQFLHLEPNDTGLGEEGEEEGAGVGGMNFNLNSAGSMGNETYERYASVGGWVASQAAQGAGHERASSISSIGSTGSITSNSHRQSQPQPTSPRKRMTKRATVFGYRPTSPGYTGLVHSMAMQIPMVADDPVSYVNSGSVSPTLREGSGGSGSPSPTPMANANANTGARSPVGRPDSPTSVASIGSIGSLSVPSPTTSEHYPSAFGALHQNQNQERDRDRDNASPPPRSGSLDVLSDSSSTEFGLKVNVESATPFRSMSPESLPPTGFTPNSNRTMSLDNTPDHPRSFSMDTMMSFEGEQTVPCWCKYPKSLFPNWTEAQQKTSGIAGVKGIEPRKAEDGAGVWILDVVKRENQGVGARGHQRTGSAGSEKGKEREVFRAGLGVPDSPVTPTMSSPFVSASSFATLGPSSSSTLPPPPSRITHQAPSDPDEIQEVSFVDKERVMQVANDTVNSCWEKFLTPRPEEVKTRVFFVDKLTGPIMQMLGTHFKIEPFFFSSTIGRIPSRFQSNVIPGKSDHLTITLPFIRSVKCPEEEIDEYYTANGRDQHLIIDTEQPLPLSESNNLLVSDMLSLHIIRSPRTNTIISIHPPPSATQKYSASAETLHSRVFATGRSVYWNHILRASRDPTFVFLSFLWYALYAWDEAFEHLYSHICFLESKIMNMNDMRLTQELHVVRAHLLHYESMLEDFRKAVVFVLSSPNQTMVGMGKEEQDEVRRDLEEQEYVLNVGYQKDDEDSLKGEAEGEVDSNVKAWLDDPVVASPGASGAQAATSGGGVDVISEEPEEEEAEDVVSPHMAQKQRRESPSTPKLSGMRSRASSASKVSQSRSPTMGVTAASSLRPRASSQAGLPPPAPSAIFTAGTPPQSPNKRPSFSTSGARPSSPTLMHSPPRSFTASTAQTQPGIPGMPHRTTTRTASLSSLANPELLRQRYELESRHRKVSRAMMRKECSKLLQEIERLEKARSMQNKRLKNVMDLGFSVVNIEDSKRMHELTKAALRDSAAMKQISYLTMVFLPSSFVAAAFGMNVIEINPDGSAARLWQYVAFSVPLTIITVWVIIALQIEMRQPNYRQRAGAVGDKPKSRRKRLMEEAGNVKGLPGSGGGYANATYPPLPHLSHRHHSGGRSAAPSINVNGAPADEEEESNSTEWDTSDTESDESEDELPEYGEYYASSRDHKAGLFGGLFRRGLASSGGGGGNGGGVGRAAGKIPTSNDPAPAPERMTRYPILGQPAGAGANYTAGGGGGNPRGMIELSLWRRLAWPVWLIVTFVERQKLKRERARRKREREERRRARMEKRKMMESRAGSRAQSRAQSRVGSRAPSVVNV